MKNAITVLFLSSVILAYGLGHGPTSPGDPCSAGGEQANPACIPVGGVSSPTAQPTTTPGPAPTALHIDVWCNIDQNSGGQNVTASVGRALCTYAENQKTLNASAATNAYFWCDPYSINHCFATQYYKPNVFQEKNPDCPLASHDPGNPFNTFWNNGPGATPTPGPISELRIAYHQQSTVAGVATRMNKDTASTGCISNPFFALQLGQSVVYVVVRTCIDGSGGMGCDPAFGDAAFIDEDNSGSRCVDLLSVGCPGGNTAITDGSNGVGLSDGNYLSATPGPGQNTLDSERKKYHDNTIRVGSITGGSCGTLFGGASPCPDPYAGSPAPIIVNQFGTVTGIGKVNVSPNATDQMVGGNGSTAVYGGMCEGCGEVQNGTTGERYSTTHLIMDINTATIVIAAGRIYKDHVAYSNVSPPDVGNAGQTAAFIQDRLDYFSRLMLTFTYRGCTGPGNIAVSCTPYDFQVTDENDCSHAPSSPCTVTPTPNPAGDNCVNDNSPQGNVCAAVPAFAEGGIIATQPEEVAKAFTAPFNANIGPNNDGGDCGTLDVQGDGGAGDHLVGSVYVSGVPPAYPVTYPDSCGFQKASGGGNKGGVYGTKYDACYHNVAGVMTLFGACASLVSARLSDSNGSGNGDYVVPCNTNIGGVAVDFSVFHHYLTLANTAFLQIGNLSAGQTDTSGYIMSNGYSDANITGGNFTCGTTPVPGGHSLFLTP